MMSRLTPLLAAFSALTAFAAPASAEPIATRFEMFGFANAHVLTLHSRTDVAGARYGVTLDFATRGIASAFVDMTSREQVSGRVLGGILEPDRFGDDSRRNGIERHSRIDYRAGADPVATTQPPIATPVAAGTLRGSIDNLTAYMRLQRQLALTGRCAMTVRVFDGRHGYDLTFSDEGRKALSPSGGQNFAGQTIACRMARRNWPGPAEPEQDEGARSGTIWYARLVPGELLVPVRMRMDSQLGVVDGYLAELHGRGVNLSLME